MLIVGEKPLRGKIRIYRLSSYVTADWQTSFSSLITIKLKFKKFIEKNGKNSTDTVLNAI